MCGGYFSSCFFQCLGITPKVICRFARLTSGRENRAGIGLQKLNPALNIRGVPEFAFNPQVGAQERRCEFRDQLLGRVRLGAEAVFEVAIEAALAAGPMTELVEFDGIEAG